MPGRMVLLRHGATEWSETGKHTGRTDIPLLAEGCEQAKAAGALVRQFGPATFGQVLVSPLVRAADTCTLAGFVGEPDPDLMEWDYGAYEGLTSSRDPRRCGRAGPSGTRESPKASGPPTSAAGPTGSFNAPGSSRPTPSVSHTGTFFAF